jgi:hypothetical protein
LLGYHITPQGFSPSQKTQEKALENAKRRYAQGGQKALAEYLHRWRTWIQASLPFKVDLVEDVIRSIEDSVGKDASLTVPQVQSGVWYTKEQIPSVSKHISRSIIRSVQDGANIKKKGKVSCIKLNFSGHCALLA